MFIFKFIADVKKQKYELQVSTNNSSDFQENGSIMNNVIKASLGLSTILSIWKYLIIPILM